MNKYKLLTPGPLTTSEMVKKEMLFDRCTWDDEYKSITQKIRKEILNIAMATQEKYTTVLMQGSGSFGVESVMQSVLSKNDKCLIIVNGAYGRRIVEMAIKLEKKYEIYEISYDKIPKISEIREMLLIDREITHIAMVHCETTTGILNPLEEIAAVSKEFGKTLIIDAMSSFGGIPIKVEELEIDFLISSANKCIQGVPGFSFIIANIEKLKRCKKNAKSLCLDLYEQWIDMDKDGKWRYTSPTHVVAAFSKAIDELIEEGGVKARYERYKNNNKHLIKNFEKLGFKVYIDEKYQSPIITTFKYDSLNFGFQEFYDFVKNREYVIYPGKLIDAETFRIGNIGEIYLDDIEKLTIIVKEFLDGKK